MNTVLVMLLVPAISILATLNIAQREIREFHLPWVAAALSILTMLAMLFIALPFRRWCRRRGKNHIGYWLLQWLLVFMPVAVLFAIRLPVWWSALVAAWLVAIGMAMALVSWFIVDCRPFKPRS